MRKRLALLQALAILIAVFQYDTRAAGQEEGRNSHRILNNFFYPYMYLLTARYVQNQVAWDLQLHGTCSGSIVSTIASFPGHHPVFIAYSTDKGGEALASG